MITGATNVHLEHIDADRFCGLAEAAWCGVAPKRLVASYLASKRG